MSLVVKATTPTDASVSPRLLPGWPIFLLIWGFPLWWVTGMLPFMPLIAGAVLGALLLTRWRETHLPPAGLPLLGFVLWVIPCAVMIDTPSRYIGFGMRAGTLVSLAIIYLYLHNAREKVRLEDLLLGACSVWGLIVLGGCLGALFPDVRLTTPVGMVLPGAITSNELVRDLVYPPLAEVQQPWGAAEPFNRPSAPFPYANGWGSGFALSTPLAVAGLIHLRKRWVRVLIVISFALSLVPVVASLNRGMFLMLGVAAAYVAVRLALRGDFKAVLLVTGAGALAAISMFALGVMDGIAARQEVSDTTSGRASIYEATLEAVWESPILGYGAPRPSEDIGINLGTQGTFWMYIFSYGLVGAALFLCFLLSAIVETSPAVTDIASACMHAVVVSALIGAFFYGFEFTQWLLIILALSLLDRLLPTRPRQPGPLIHTPHG